jgi:hypothetical protein
MPITYSDHEIGKHVEIVTGAYKGARGQIVAIVRENDHVFDCIKVKCEGIPMPLYYKATELIELR